MTATYPADFSPGIIVDAAVTMATVGAIQAGGFIDVQFRQPPAVSFLSGNVTFLEPVGVEGTASWNNVSGLMSVRTRDADIGRLQRVAFVLHGFSSPVSSRNLSTPFITTYTADKRLIDGPGNMTVSAINPGRIDGSPRWALLSDTGPGVRTNATVSFRNEGSMKGSESKIVVNLPEFWSKQLWSNPEHPEIHFTSPVQVSGTCNWNASLNTLTVFPHGADIISGSRVEFTIVNITKPASAHNESTAVLTTKTLQGGIIDGPTDMSIDEVKPGVLSGLLTWDLALDSPPGIVTNVTVSFRTYGVIPVNGTIQINLGNIGWSLPAEVLTTFVTPHLLSNISSVWNQTTHTFTIHVGDNQFPGTTDVQFVVANVTNPPSVTDAYNATIKTTTGRGGLVDGPAYLTTDSIVSMNLTALEDGFRPMVLAPANSTTDIKISFTLSGPVSAGSRIQVDLPRHNFSHNRNSCQVQRGLLCVLNNIASGRDSSDGSDCLDHGPLCRSWPGRMDW